MRYYDISLNLSPDTVRWVVAPPLEVHERRRMSRGDDVNATALTVSVHAGTHVDAPFHFLPDGAAIDSVPLERFMGPALVHQVDADRFITEAHVKAIAHADTQVPVHRAFLDHGVVLLEGIDLSEISPGLYELICFPLRLRGLDGAPCRAVLRDLHPS